MAQLSSPGVAVTVIDESFYTPAAAGTTPLIIVASAENKLNGAGTGIAAGTLKANAGQVYLLTSQKDLSDTFGTPVFKTDASNNPVHAGEQNEYGLQAAYSYLGVSNRVFAVRADIDLAQLDASADAPTGNPAAGTLWMDLTSTTFGVFEWNATTQAFTHKTATIITSDAKIDNGAPKAYIGGIGDYAIVAGSASNLLRLWTKNNSGTWVEVGTSSWSTGGKVVQISKHTQVPEWKSTDTSPAVTGSVWVKITEPNQGTRFRVKKWNDATGLWDAVSAPIYTQGQSAIYGLDKAGGGANLGAGAIYVKANDSETTNAVPDFKAYVRAGVGATKVTSSVVGSGTLEAGSYSFTLEETTTGVEGFANPVTVTYTAAGNATDASTIAAAINTANLTNVRAEVNSLNQIVITHLTGGDIRISDTDQPDNSPNQFTFGTLFTTGAGNFYDDPAGNDQAVYTANSALVSVGGTTAYQVGDQIQVGTSGSGQVAATFAVAQLQTSFTFASVAITGVGGQLSFASTSGLIRGTSVVVTGTNTGTGSITNGTYYIGGTPTNTTCTLHDSYAHAIAGTNAITTTAGTPIGLTFTVGTVAGPIKTATAGAITLVNEGVQNTGPTNAQPTVATTGQGAGATIQVTWSGPGTNKYLVTLWAPVLRSSLYQISESTPSTIPADSTLWYNSMIDEVDMMVHNGKIWCGYRYLFPNTDAKGPTVSATAPKLQQDGVSALVDNDLWISTADLENFPLIYRRKNAKWVLLDTADQTTENGVLFHDARWGTDGGTPDGATDSTIPELLTSNYVDFDAPDPALYPKGMLLWNLRRSGFNVKQWKMDYVDTAVDNPRYNSTYNDAGNSPVSGNAQTNYYPHRWVSVAANQENGAGTFGRHAQRKVVIQALQALVNANQQIRDEEARVFNLIACPGYPELIGEMISLNYDRGLTAFVVGDTPARLAADATSLNNWGTNQRGALEDNDNGLVSSDEYLGVFYPWGYTSDNIGNNVVVPPSHMILRTIALSDNVSYPWFAPAGTRRGGITNATAVGYIDSITGEFQSVALNTGQRDTLASIKVNPITFITGTGLVNYGQYTRAKNASALDRINVARLIVYLRRQLSILAKPYVFEPNDKITRDEIKQAAESLMLELVGQRALYDYIVVCDTSNNTPSRIDRSELYLDIAIEPVKAVEFIYIPLRLKNTGEIKGLGK